jgi:VanZ family protein
MKQLKNYAPAIGWGIVIFILSIIPGKDIPQIASPWDLVKMDKLVHMTIYGILMWQILRVSSKIHRTTSDGFQSVGYWLKAAVFCSLYGLFLEWVQETFCEGRAFELYDALANSIGAFGGVLVFYLYQQLKRSKTP